MEKIAKNITQNVFRIGKETYIYIIKRHDETIIIDTGNRKNRQELEFAVKAVVKPEEVDKVIFTHLHADCVGNYDFFPKAGLYASEVEIADFKAAPEKTTLSEEVAERLKKAFIKPIFDGMSGFEVIPVPGHTMGSIALYDKIENILFTGDSYFGNNIVGTTDHPTSSPTALKESITYLKENFPDAIICPMRKVIL